jgi:hypothetical protein
MNDRQAIFLLPEAVCRGSNSNCLEDLHPGFEFGDSHLLVTITIQLLLPTGAVECFWAS